MPLQAITRHPSEGEFEGRRSAPQRGVWGLSTLVKSETHKFSTSTAQPVTRRSQVSSIHPYSNPSSKAVTNPGRVYSVASISTLPNNSRQVAEVCGPIEAIHTRSCQPDGKLVPIS